MKNLRKEFPVLSQYTYLNTASSGLLYDSLLEFRQGHDLDFLIEGSLFRDSQTKFLDSVRQTIADFFNGSAKNSILTQNFSLGLNILLSGFEKDKKILLLNEDYPSVNFAVTSKGFDVCYAIIDANLEDNVLKAIEQQQPDIFAFSLVQYLNGIAIDPTFIKKLKAEYPKLLMIADGSQFCGTRNFDFKNSGIDILGCTGYKWLLGGYGSGFFLFQEGVLDQITPNSYKDNALTSIYNTSYTDSKARFECGHMDTLTFGSLQHSLKFLSTIGMTEMEQHINEVSAYAKSKLSAKGLLEKSVVNRQYHSSIFTIQGDRKLFEHLKSNNIITTFRSNGIRISLHFYNSKNDIDILLKHL